MEKKEKEMEQTIEAAVNAAHKIIMKRSNDKVEQISLIVEVVRRLMEMALDQISGNIFLSKILKSIKE